jgi:hypothetical protein
MALDLSLGYVIARFELRSLFVALVILNDGF